jgi:hypothetical protein
MRIITQFKRDLLCSSVALNDLATDLAICEVRLNSPLLFDRNMRDKREDLKPHTVNPAASQITSGLANGISG